MTPEAQSPEAVHSTALVIDTHADTPQRFLDEGYDLNDALNGGDFNLDTARKGNLGAQFFAIWAEPTIHRGHYARRSLELIDAVRQQVVRHPKELMLATSAAEIELAHSQRKLAVLMGIEGGHSIENSLALLRNYYALGARYMTLTWTNSNGWADSSGDENDPKVLHTPEGLSAFGEDVIREMNRLGMMVDVSHVSDKTFYRALSVSRAPVIASHSAARALCDCPRNLSDEMLRAIARSGGTDSKGGVVQVVFYSAFLWQPYRDALEKIRSELDKDIQACKEKAKVERRAVNYLEIAQIEKHARDRIPRPPFVALIDHIDHIAKVAGVDHVGLGSDFDGVYGQLPDGLDSPAAFPRITAELMARGYSAEDCRKILGGNLLRVFREVEAVARSCGQ